MRQEKALRYETVGVGAWAGPEGGCHRDQSYLRGRNSKAGTCQGGRSAAEGTGSVGTIFHHPWHLEAQPWLDRALNSNWPRTLGTGAGRQTPAPRSSQVLQGPACAHGTVLLISLHTNEDNQSPSGVGKGDKHCYPHERSKKTALRDNYD